MRALIEQMLSWQSSTRPKQHRRRIVLARELAGDIVQKYRLRATEQGVALTAAR